MDSKDFIGPGDGIPTTWHSGYENLEMQSAKPVKSRLRGYINIIPADEMPPKILIQQRKTGVNGEIKHFKAKTSLCNFIILRKKAFSIAYILRIRSL